MTSNEMRKGYHGPRTVRFGILLVLSLLAAAVIPVWAGSARKADLSRLVVVGDSLSVPERFAS